jgi:beta-lactamase regulating signal transducer with metallopeptidase domain
MTLWVTIAGWTLVHFVWQGALIAGAAALALRLLRAATPQARYLVTGTALTLMLLSPLITAGRLSSTSIRQTGTNLTPETTSTISNMSNRSRAATARGPVATARRPQRHAGVDPVFPVIVSVWLSGVVLLSLRLLGGWWRVRRLQSAALSISASAWQTVADRVADRLRLRRRVHVIEMFVIDTPSVIGWWRPVLLLPVTAFGGLTVSQAEAILAHELAHVQRHDYVVNVFQSVAETILFYHPAVWWISHRMRIEREQCCDAVVVQLGADARDYASALVRLEQARSSAPATLAVAASGGVLVDRIRRILSPAPDPRRPIAPAAVTAAMLLLFLAIAGGYAPVIRMLEARGQAGDAVIATVNDESITQADLDHFLPLHGEPSSTPIDRVLVQLIDERLLVQRGAQLGFTVGSRESQRALASVKQQNHFATDAALEAQLAKQRLTMNDLVQHLQRGRMVYQVARAEERNGFAIADDEARQYFDSHLDEFPFQTFDLVKPELVTRLTLTNLGHGIVPEVYMRTLRSAATIAWTRPDLQRLYDAAVAQRTASQRGVESNTRPSPTPATQDWRLYATTHLDVLFTPDLSGQLDRVERELERGYQRISRDLRHDVAARLNVVLFANSATRTANAPAVPNAPAPPAPSTRILLALDEPDDAFRASIAHEITHVFEFDILPSAVAGTTPQWMLEGLAEYEGQRWAAGDQVMLRELVRDNAVPTLSTLGPDVSQVNRRFAYSVGHAAFDFIDSQWGADGIRRLLFVLRSGVVDRQAVYSRAFSVGPTEFDQRFEAYIRGRFQ